MYIMCPHVKVCNRVTGCELCKPLFVGEDSWKRKWLISFRCYVLEHMGIVESRAIIVGEK